ncbi:LysR family transcriptional regulator [Sphaerisporangium krabiense]|uniref:LysR family transcriptional regulator n=1 Tax=Sphaerisporangium krabiense TaxID=763782 RepID=UPI001A37CF28|nr:LysR family transcriptional regulator [Sphaerisporangium krabiense]GII61701.1 LysR family transcriptional regulator [Sphaerisporangium krabiense]
MRTFEAVARHRTVTDAAVALELSPSSVSEQIRTLERSLGVTLFERTPKGMRLTEAGERLLSWTGRLLDQAEQARREVTGHSRALRLGALETIAATHVPGVLARLTASRPDADVQVVPSASRDELLAAMTAGRLDAALLLDTGDALGDLGFAAPPAPLTFVDVDMVPLALVAAPGHRLAESTQVVPDDLNGERLLVNVPACSFWMAADRILGPGPERVRAGSVAVIRAWAEQGLGLALLPEFAISDSLTNGTLTRLPLTTPDLSLRLVWRSDRETLPGLRDLLYAASA